MFNILVVEDNKSTSKLLCALLSHNGYKAYAAENGIAGLEMLDKVKIDLIILDIMMPEMDGYEFCEELRDNGDYTPILMLTAKQIPEDRYKGFRSGTDDYMTKPFDNQELLFRIKALLRRSKIVSERKLNIGKITLDYNSFTVSDGENIQTLPQKEFELLYKLLSYPNQIFTRLQLMDEIWGMDSESVDTTVNVHIHRLRKRFEDCNEFEIKAIRGIGYKAVIKIEQ